MYQKKEEYDWIVVLFWPKAESKNNALKSESIQMDAYG